MWRWHGGSSSVSGSVTAQRWRQLGGGAVAVAASAAVAAVQSAAVAHSATAAARWEQRGGCGGFTDTVRECANARAFDCHQRTDVHVFVLGRGRRDDSADGIVVVATTAAFVATPTAVANAPPLPTTTPMATPTTLFVKLNLIYYYYLFIYHYVD